MARPSEDADQAVLTPPEPERDPEPDPPAAESTVDAGAESPPHSQFTYHFNGDVHAFGANFGVSGVAPIRRVTGRISGAEVTEALRHWVAPAEFARAEAVLREHRVVVLVSPDSSGKRTAALALLHRIAPDAEPIRSLVPTDSYARLVSRGFRDNQRYLVHDRVVSEDPLALQRFDAERLIAKLAEANAHLVITTAAAPVERRYFEHLVVDWRPPDRMRLFRAVFGNAPLPAGLDGDLLAARVAQLPPGRVVALAEQLAEQPDTALDVLRDSARGKVVEWFDAGPTRRDVLTVAALAVVYGLSEQLFEQLLADLLDQAGLSEPSGQGGLSGVSGLGGTGGEAEQPDQRPAPDQAFPQRRAEWSSRHPLITTTRADPRGTGRPRGGRRVVFRAEDYREWVIAELVERYDHELWTPLRAWMRRVARSGPPEARVQLAFAVALLSRDSVSEVEESLLAEWSDGGPAERLTASCVLSMMCVDDSLAPDALRIALDWATGADQADQADRQRAVTAAGALGGALGIRYPAEALSWLWLLAMRDSPVRDTACASIAALIGETAGDAEASRFALGLTTAELRDRLRGNARGAEAEAALDVVTTLLSSVRADTGEPVVSVLLREQPDNTDALGALWAEVLRSAAHSEPAVTALRQALEGLGQDDTARQAAHRLGAAVRSGLSDSDRVLLTQDLAEVLRAGPRQAGLPHALLSALLADQPTAATAPGPATTEDTATAGSGQDQTYPVVEERRLAPVRRRWWRFFRRRRDTAELPERRPGTVHVFEVDGEYATCGDRGHPRGHHRVVVRAVSVSVVDVRERTVVARLTVPSANAAAAFQIEAVFRCQVTAPEEVAGTGLTDLAPLLTDHLAQDTLLPNLGTGLPVSAVNQLWPRADARIRAYCVVDPPSVPGMTVALQRVDVLVARESRGAAQGRAWQPGPAAFGHDGDELVDLFGRTSDAVSTTSTTRPVAPAGPAGAEPHQHQQRAHGPRVFDEDELN